MEQKLRAKFYKKFGPVFIEELIDSFYDSYQDKGFSTAFEKLRDNIFTFYRIQENSVGDSDLICKLFSKTKTISATRNEKLEFKIFFQFEFLRNSGNSRPGQRALNKLKPNLDRYRLYLNIEQGSEAFFKFFKEILIANYKALWCFREILEHLQLEDEIAEPARVRKKPAPQKKKFVTPPAKTSSTPATSNSSGSPISVISPRRPQLNRNLHGSFATKKTVQLPIKRAEQPTAEPIEIPKAQSLQRLQQMNKVSFYGNGRQNPRRQSDVLVKQTPTKEEPRGVVTGEAVYRNIFAGYSNGN